MKKIIFSIVIATTIFTSCKKESTTPEYNSAQKGILNVEFDNVVGSADLQLNTGSYTNAAGNPYKITMLKYFVSNFKATTTGGVEVIVPQDSCYFLIDESNIGKQMASLKLPEGEYKTISFLLGVDSLRNTKNVSERTGDLDVTAAASGMYWSWNSGYINFKFEGTSTAVTGMMAPAFQIHIGGFGGYSTPTANNGKIITLDLAPRGTAKVKASKADGVDVHLLVDVNKVFTGTTTVNLATTSMVHSIAAGTSIASNLSNLFTHDHTHN
jgi:hypothetical protein